MVALGVLAAGAIAATQPWTQVGQGRRRAAMDAAIRAAVDAPIGNDAIGNAIGNAVGIDLDVRARIQARGFRLLALAPGVPLIRVDARTADSCLATLIALVEHALARTEVRA